MSKVAWIGLGAMGVGMARRLIDAGHDVTVWNRTTGRADALTAAGARAAATPADAVRGAEAVFLMLADPAAVGEVTEGPLGIAAGISTRTVVVDMSTVGPVALARLRAVLQPEVMLLDAPVLGSVAEAAGGNLTLLVGGPAAAVAELRPLLSVLGNLVHLGPTGTGAAAKLVANFSLLGTVGILGEALAIADGLRLPREVTWRVLSYTPLAAQAERRRPLIESGAFVPRFPLGLARKDADLIVAAANAAGADVRLARAVQVWLDDAEAAGLGTLDYTAILDYIPASRGTLHSPISDVVTSASAPHYLWGAGCEGWRLVDTAGLSVMEERMPPGSAEQWHVHDRARQFFLVLDGQATMGTPDGEVSIHAGAGVQIAPGTQHQVANTSGRDLRLLVVSAPTTRGDRRLCPAPRRVEGQA